MEDAMIIQRIIHGNANEYSVIVNKYQRLIKLIVSKYVSNKETIEDLTQEILTKVYFKLNTYNNEFKFSTWLGRIATNHCIDYKRKNRMSYVSIDETMELRDQKQTPQEIIEKAELALLIKEKTKKLDKKYSEPLNLYHKDNLSYKEIADKLQLPMSLVKNRIYRARKTLKDEMQIYKDRGEL